MPRMAKIVLTFGAIGLAIGLGIAAYLQFTSPHAALSDRVFLAFAILCPPSLLSITIIDAEPGTGAFYAVWLVIAVLNSAFYMAVAGALGLLVFFVRSWDKRSN